MLTLMVALGQMSIGLYLPSLPTLTKVFGATMGEVQLTLTAYLVGFSISQLLIGPMSDRFGRRPVLFLGLGVFVCASLACTAASTIEALILFRLLQAFGACAGQALSRAILRDLAEGAEAAKVMSLIAISMSVSLAITPSLGAQVYVHLGWAANFLLLAAVGVLLLALCVLRLPETNRTPDATATDPRRMLRNYATLLTDRTFLGYALSLGFLFSALFAYPTGSPQILMVQLGFSPEQFGLLNLFNVFGFLAGSIIANRVGQRYGVRRTALFGCVLVAVSGIGMIVPAGLGLVSAPTVVAPMMLLLCGMGIALPNATVAALQGFPRMAGAASALIGFTQMGLAGLGSATVGALQGDTPLAMQIVFAVSAVACLAVPLAIGPGKAP